MKDYPFSFEQLNKFSLSKPYESNLNSVETKLLQELNHHQINLNFPAIREDIGQLINFLFKWVRPKRIFEFGSGYGHSSFWYFLNNNFIESVILTEKRDDLLSVYNSLDWPSDWKNKTTYIQGDAFETFKNVSELDFILIDGVKADYLRFLKESETKINSNGMVLIDNSYWRGSFLDSDLVQSKNSARMIKELHEYINKSEFWEAVFLPYEDGVTLLRPILSQNI